LTHRDTRVNLASTNCHKLPAGVARIIQHTKVSLSRIANLIHTKRSSGSFHFHLLILSLASRYRSKTPNNPANLSILLSFRNLSIRPISISSTDQQCCLPSSRFIIPHFDRLPHLLSRDLWGEAFLLLVFIVKLNMINTCVRFRDQNLGLYLVSRKNKTNKMGSVSNQSFAQNSGLPRDTVCRVCARVCVDGAPR
jgi:hypothetical protein